MSSGFFRLKLKSEEQSYDSKIFEYPDIDEYFSAFSKCVSENGAFPFKAISKAQICVPIDNIEYLIFIPEEYLKKDDENE